MKSEFKSPRMDRRSTLMLIGAAVPALALFTKSADAYQMPEVTAHYVPNATDGKPCSKCAFFEGPHSCKVVKGTISPKGTCMLWRAH
jgi:hypothetical protein